MAAAIAMAASAIAPIVLQYGPAVAKKVSELVRKYGPEFITQLVHIMSATLNKDSLRHVLSDADYAKISKDTKISLPLLYQQLDKQAAADALTKLMQQQIQTSQTFQNIDPSAKSSAMRLVGDIFHAIGGTQPQSQPQPQQQHQFQILTPSQLPSPFTTLSSMAQNPVQVPAQIPAQVPIQVQSPSPSPSPSPVQSSIVESAVGRHHHKKCSSSAFHTCLFDLAMHKLLEPVIEKNVKKRKSNMDDTDSDQEEKSDKMAARELYVEPRIKHLQDIVRSSIVNSVFMQNYLEQHEAAHAWLLNRKEWTRASDIIHLLYFLKLYVDLTITRQVSKRVEAPRCELCNNSSGSEKLLNEVFFELWDARDQIVYMLNVYYECDLAAAREFIQLIKPPCFPYHGTFPWDMNQYIDELFVRENMFRDFDPVMFHGVVYRTTSRAALDGITEQMIASTLSLKRPVFRHAFLIADGDIIKPKHWCGMFIDLNARVAIFYNSLAKPEQENWHLVDAFNQVCAQRGLAVLSITDRITNRVPLQKDSNLCGHFVYDFFREMLKQPSSQLVEMFQDYARPPRPGQFLDEALRNKVSSDFRFSNDKISIFAKKFASHKKQ